MKRLKVVEEDTNNAKIHDVGVYRLAQPCQSSRLNKQQLVKRNVVIMLRMIRTVTHTAVPRLSLSLAAVKLRWLAHKLWFGRFRWLCTNS